MAHRGRLNVLAHNLGRPYETIFAEFEGVSTLEAITTIPQGGTGDVKYHHGAQGSYQLPDGDSILVNLESNPSHLEYVHPVVVGASRAAQTTRQGPHAHRDTAAAVPDRPARRRGLPRPGRRRRVAEPPGARRLPGRRHASTSSRTTRSASRPTPRTRGPPAGPRTSPRASTSRSSTSTPTTSRPASAAVRLAFAFRQEFGHDVLIDLIGYRRFGHNEADEPAYTQPEMYAKIKNKKRVSELWAERLVAEGVVTQEEVEQQRQGIWDHLTQLHQNLKAQIKAAEETGAVTQQTGEYQLDRSPSPEVKTAVVRRPAADAQRGAAARSPRASRSTPSSSSSSSAGARRSAPTAASTGRTPRRWPSPRC